MERNESSEVVQDSDSIERGRRKEREAGEKKRKTKRMERSKGEKATLTVKIELKEL